MLHGILTRDVWWEGEEEIQCNTYMNREQDKAGPQLFFRVEEVANDLIFA